jgi:uncharacterized protein (TIGR00255 family)
MIQSMTGFGSAEADEFRVEIRSLNHRFIDVSIKCPPAINKHEMTLREMLKNRFKRGKFDVHISFLGDAGVKTKLNTAMAKNVFAMLNELKEAFDIQENIGIDDLLKWKDLFIEEEASYKSESLYEAFNAAAKTLEIMRLKEGESLVSDISSRIDAIESLNTEVVSRCPSIIKSMREKFLQNLKSLFEGIECDDSRLLQEAATLAEKCDITEEVVRLKSHFEHMRNILSEGDAVGRKMDFLVQELNREANTIASKAGDTGVSECVIRMKAEIERVREQVQNVQ